MTWDGRKRWRAQTQGDHERVSRAYPSGRPRDRGQQPRRRARSRAFVRRPQIGRAIDSAAAGVWQRRPVSRGRADGLCTSVVAAALMRGRRSVDRHHHVDTNLQARHGQHDHERRQKELHPHRYRTVSNSPSTTCAIRQSALSGTRTRRHSSPRAQKSAAQRNFSHRLRARPTVACKLRDSRQTADARTLRRSRNQSHISTARGTGRSKGFAPKE